MRLQLLLGGLLLSTAAGAQMNAEVAQMNRICESMIGQGDYEETLNVCRRVEFDAGKLAYGSRGHVDSLVNLSEVKARHGDYADADRYAAAALRLEDASGRHDAPASLAILQRLVRLEVAYTRIPQARAAARRMLAEQEKHYGADSLAVAQGRAAYADVLALDYLTFAQAEQEYGRAIAGLKQQGEAGAAAYPEVARRLGDLYARQTRNQLAREQYEGALAALRANDAASTAAGPLLDRLGYTAAEDGDTATAIAWYREELGLLSGNHDEAGARRVRALLDPLQPAAATPPAGTR